MAITPYLRLQKPPFDDIPWDDAVNTNMDKIDAFAAQFLGIPNYVGAWQNATAYVSGQNVSDITTSSLYQAQITHTSSVLPTTFAQERVAHPTYWQLVSVAPPPNSLTNPGNVGRNLIHNSLFSIAQRGGGGFNAVTSGWTYSLDRWALIIGAAGEVFNHIRIGMTDAYRAQIGDESADAGIACNFTGGAGAAASCISTQFIEKVSRLSGKTVTVSFYAIAAVGSPKLGVSLDQSFGTGGSPSASVSGTGQSVTISTTTWMRYSLTFTLGSTAGKNGGTAGNDYTALLFWHSSGANNATRSGNVGVQTGTHLIWGVQLEVGSVATPLEKPDPRYDLDNCQRFYQVGQVLSASYAVAAITVSIGASFKVAMRASPVVVIVNNFGYNVTGLIITPTLDGIGFSGTATATGAWGINHTYTASADL